MKILYSVYLFLAGGFVYQMIEMAWRARTHWSMFILGGLCFLSVNLLRLTVLKDCCLEPNFESAVGGDSYQFVRNGFFCIDSKDSKPDALVFNRIVSLKSSFKLNK